MANVPALNTVRLLKAVRLFCAHEGRVLDELGRIDEFAVFVKFKGTGASVEVKPVLRADVDLTEGLSPST